MENVKKFYDALSKDKAMQDRAMALVKKDDKLEMTTPPFGHPSKEGNDEAAVKAAVIAFAKAEGFSFTEAELDAFAKQATPLADESMDAAAGGGGCACVTYGAGGDGDGEQDICACYMGGVGVYAGTDDLACMCVFVGGGTL